MLTAHYPPKVCPKLSSKKAIVETKISLFAFLLCGEEYDGFPKHLDLALAPNKTNEGVKKQ